MKIHGPGKTRTIFYSMGNSHKFVMQIRWISAY